jgi:hypothetical protein
VIQGAFKISERVRDANVTRRRATTNGDQSNHKDKEEQDKAAEGLNLIEEMMKEEIVESENDVSSLSMSYLFVNVVRLLLTGYLPDEAAEEPHEFKPQLWSNCFAIYAIGVICVLVACLQATAMHKYHLRGRILNTVLNATAMCFAWCVLWGTHWTVDWWLEHNGINMHHILQKVVIAFVLTAFATGMVFVVDKIDDALEAAVNEEPGGGNPGDKDKADEEAAAMEPLTQSKTAEAQSAHELAREMIRIIVTSLGILVGFSWEHCFDGGVESVSEKAPSQLHVHFQLVLGILVCILVLPAWRKYILQKVMLMEEMREEEEKEEIPMETSGRDSDKNSNASGENAQN